MFKHGTEITTFKTIMGFSSNKALLNGKWVPARPMGFCSFRYRIKAAWKVFIGECDALQWPEGQ